MLFGFYRGIRPFYAACRFDELSRGSVSCLLNASLEKRFPQHHNSVFYAEIDDHGVCRDDTGQILARSWRSVASRVALDLPYWVMRSAPYPNGWQFRLPWQCSGTTRGTSPVTGSHWMPPSVKCLHRIALPAVMVKEFELNTQNTNKTKLLASNYGRFRSLVVCEKFNPKQTL